MSNIAQQVADSLLQIKAIKLEPTKPFTWASGWKSPIYCDNRVTLSHAGIRTLIRDGFVQKVKELYPEVEVIAGVATGAIAQGALVAQELGLPFIYVRSAAKDHGMSNLIEGHLEAGQKVVVIEDLISTGGSSLKAVDALRAAGAEVLGMLAIFTYGFENAASNFEKSAVKLDTLTNYHTLIENAIASGYVTSEQRDSLNNWRVAPDKWGI